MDPTDKIDYIECPTRDISQTKEFFTKLFGWKFQDFGPEYTVYNDGRMAGGFFQSKRVASTSDGSVLIVFYSPILEESRDKVISLGGKIVQDIFSFPGGRRFQFTDPAGSEFAIWSDK